MLDENSARKLYLAVNKSAIIQLQLWKMDGKYVSPHPYSYMLSPMSSSTFQSTEMVILIETIKVLCPIASSGIQEMIFCMIHVKHFTK